MNKNRLAYFRILGCCVCAALLCSSILVDPSNALCAAAAQGSQAALGNETADPLKSMSNIACVTRDMRTGAITTAEFDVSSINKNMVIEPHIPEGLEVAKPTKAIIGQDNRTQVTNVNEFPFSAVVHLTITSSNGRTSYGTGAYVSPTLILTSGHIIKHQNIGWAERIMAKPGGKDSTFGTADAISVTGIRGQDSSTRFDYALVEVDRNLGAGAFGLECLSDAQFPSSVFTSFGYPGDKPSGTLWTSSGESGPLGSDWFHHTIDTKPGHSGGPIFRQVSPYYICGVHVGAVNSNYNKAARVNGKMVSLILQYLNE